MERQVKALYIITICAIVAFLGMQAYWLNARYRYAFDEYAGELTGRIVDAVTEYNNLRRLDNSNDEHINNSHYRLEQQHSDTAVTVKRNVDIITYHLKAHDLLGIPHGTKLTPEQQHRAAEIAMEMEIGDRDTIGFDVSSAPDENEAWKAARNVETEMKSPFTVAGIDSVLSKAGIPGEARLVRADTMIWTNTMQLSHSGFSPSLTVTVPYSQLECKLVEITSPISVDDVLPSMLTVLVVSALLSLLLIICLVWQIATIVKMNRLDRMRNNFVVTMIHELKRPISTLKMCVSGIGNPRMMADGEVRAELLGSTRTALDTLSAYFSKLRDITFNNASQIPLNPTRFSLAELVGEVAGGITRPGGKTVDIDSRVDAGTSITADRVHLANILSNLVENAVKYSGASVTITISARTTDGAVEIAVSDNGHGIAQADLHKIFERFYRSRKAADSDLPGMGLGLAYAKLLTEAHGGSIDVESREGAGSCFTITLPQ